VPARIELKKIRPGRTEVLAATESLEGCSLVPIASVIWHPRLRQRLCRLMPQECVPPRVSEQKVIRKPMVRVDANARIRLRLTPTDRSRDSGKRHGQTTKFLVTSALLALK
jgi:hypothetical protein